MKLFWKKVVTREYPYIWATYTIECYQVMKSMVGTTLENNLFYGEGPILSIYRTDEDVQRSYKMIQDLVKNDPDHVVEMMNTHELLVKKVYELLDEIELENVRDKVRDRLLEFDQLWVRTVSHYLFFVFMGYAGDLEGIHSFISEHKKRFEDIRNKYTIDVDVNERYPLLFEKYKAGFGELAGFMSPRELRDLLQDKSVDLEKIKSRKERYLIKMVGSDVTEYYNNDIDSVLSKEFGHLKIDKDKKEIKGSVAYRGKVVGRARLIFTKSDYNGIEGGDVIVTPMTKPNIVPYLNKASAIVTNDGGALCHASIIAREMKKPCIVGTTCATDLIKDGDMVEVDAERGVVRILE